MKKAAPLQITITVEGEHRGGKSIIATKIAYALRYAGIDATTEGVDPFAVSVDQAYRNITERSPIKVHIIEKKSERVQIDCRSKPLLQNYRCQGYTQSCVPH